VSSSRREDPSDILVHRDTGGNRTLEVMVMNNNVVVANTTIGVNGVTWDVDGTGDFNHDGTPDILQHQINLNAGRADMIPGGYLDARAGRQS
jgi:hypothetical protein